MVRIDMVRAVPLKCLDSSISGGPSAGRFGTNDQMLAVGFVPNWDDFDALFSGLHAGAQLGPRLVRKPVANSN
jgi:hypothetical protein